MRTSKNAVAAVRNNAKAVKPAITDAKMARKLGKAIGVIKATAKPMRTAKLTKAEKVFGKKGMGSMTAISAAISKMAKPENFGYFNAADKVMVKIDGKMVPGIVVKALPSRIHVETKNGSHVIRDMDIVRAAKNTDKAPRSTAKIKADAKVRNTEKTNKPKAERVAKLKDAVKAGTDAKTTKMMKRAKATVKHLPLALAGLSDAVVVKIMANVIATIPTAAKPAMYKNGVKGKAALAAMDNLRNAFNG